MLKKHFSLEGEIKGILEKELLEIGLDVGMRQIIHRFPLVGDFSGITKLFMGLTIHISFLDR